MKEIMNAIETYNNISFDLENRGEELKLNGKTRAAKKLQVLYLELMPYIELYKSIPLKERQTIRIIIKEGETYSKSPFIYLGSNKLEPELYAYENGHSKRLHENIELFDDDYRCFCILTPLIQEMDINDIKNKFKNEIINKINVAIRSKQNKLSEIEKALSDFDSEDTESILYKQLYELFGLEREYKETGDEFCLSLVLNQIEKIQKMIEEGEN